MGVIEEVECAVNAMQELESTVYKLGNRPVNDQWRKKMVKWIYRTADSVGASRDLACLGTYYLDMLLAKETDSNLIQKTRDLQLATATCFFLAIKLHNSTCICLETILEHSENEFTGIETKVMEAYILCQLNYRTQPPTARSFHRQLIRVIPPDRGEESNVLLVHTASLYFIDLATKNYSFTKYSGSLVASAAMILAAQGMRIEFPFRLRLHRIVDALHGATELYQVYQLMKITFGDTERMVNRIRVDTNKKSLPSSILIPIHTKKKSPPSSPQKTPPGTKRESRRSFKTFMVNMIRLHTKKKSLPSSPKIPFDATDMEDKIRIYDTNKPIYDTNKKDPPSSPQKSPPGTKQESPQSVKTFMVNRIRPHTNKKDLPSSPMKSSDATDIDKIPIDANKKSPPSSPKKSSPGTKRESPRSVLTFIEM